MCGNAYLRVCVSACVCKCVRVTEGGAGRKEVTEEHEYSISDAGLVIGMSLPDNRRATN